MDKARKQYLDSLWMNTEVGVWAQAKSIDNKEKSDAILEKIFEEGNRIDENGYLVAPEKIMPLRYLLDEEKKLCEKVKQELTSAREGWEYALALDEENGDLMDIMIAYEFSLIDLLDDLYHEVEKYDNC